LKKIPIQFSLHQNYPNHSTQQNQNSEIPSPLGRGRESCTAVITTCSGEVATLVNEQLKTGTYEVGGLLFGGRQVLLRSGCIFINLYPAITLNQGKWFSLSNELRITSWLVNRNRALRRCLFLFS
jgi:hypothetical protein